MYFPDVVVSRFTEQVDNFPDIVDIFLKVLTIEDFAECKVMD